MRCLSVRQPYAWAICTGDKRIENRTWDTEYRGQIAIHASSSMQHVNALRKTLGKDAFDPSLFPTGAVIGVADIVDCTALNQTLEENVWAQGPRCWVLEHARFIAEPIPLKGKLNLFYLPPDVATAVERQLERPPPAANPTQHQSLIDALRMTASERLDFHMHAYWELQQYDDMIRVANKAVDSGEHVHAALRCRAYGYVQSQQFAAALPDIERALEFQSQDALMYGLRYVARFELGHDGALQDWETARQLGLDLPKCDE